MNRLSLTGSLSAAQRCCPLSPQDPFTQCPVCGAPAQGLWLIPMVFVELDEATQEAAQTSLSSKRGMKRHNATLVRLNPDLRSAEANSSTEEGTKEPKELRTGRWTNEETAYCDRLIQEFEAGTLPIPNGIKLNDFLSNMFKSKHSRLTKKMKNARLSARQYQRTTGFIQGLHNLVEISRLETEFLASIKNLLERSEIKFHMQKEWRELFSSYCAEIGQPLDADAWLNSVEEIDRRASLQKDKARMRRRKIMMGRAHSLDTSHDLHGIFIDPNASTEKHSHTQSSSGGSMASDNDNSHRDKRLRIASRTHQQRNKNSSSPFAARVIQFIERHNLPFEHIDIWVPSYMPQLVGRPIQDQTCRLCFAGSATTNTEIPPNGGPPEPLSSQEQFDLNSFGEYSRTFSFDIGCGVPGRVYSSGIASWEQGIQNAPRGQFERVGGAVQWGIQTVLGVPVPSPNVGRLIVLFYSRHDRSKNQEMVHHMTHELAKVSLFQNVPWYLI